MMLRSLVVSAVVFSCASVPVPSAPAPSSPGPSGSGSPSGAALPAAPASGPAFVAPPTRRIEAADVLHGVTVPDPYRWLEDEHSPEVQAWMRAQDDAARAYLHALPGRDALLRRFRELLYVDEISVPSKFGNRFFYSRQLAQKEKAIVYWKEGEDGQERVLLDPNGWSADNTVSLGGWMPSWDGQWVAFQRKPNAADEATLCVQKVDTGEVSEIDVIPGGKYATAAWTPDGSGFYYVWLPTDPAIPASERPGYAEVRFHALGTDPARDPLVFPRTNNPGEFLGVQLSRDGKYLAVSKYRGWAESSLLLRQVNNVIPTAKTRPGAGFTLLVDGKNARYDLAIWKDRLYITTDEHAPHLKVMVADAARPERAHWRELVAEDPEATLLGAGVVGGVLELSYLKNAASELRLATLEGTPIRTLALPSIGTASGLSGNEDEDDAYFSFGSFTVPREIYRTSVKTGQTTRWAKVSVPIDPAPYTVEQVWYPSKDGTRVSMFLVHRKDWVKDGNNPVWLYGYGGFNISMTPSFAASLYPWLEHGGVYAVANLRGGGEYGAAWHEAGMGHRKQNVFDDFIGAAEFLIREKITRPERLGISGGSNGGLLTGAMIVQRPELFGAVVCAVPLLDMVRYERFGSGKTWAPEYGTVADPADFQALRAYSPYHQVQPGRPLPPLLLMSADHDDRVDPLHARKFAAAIQQAARDGAADPPAAAPQRSPAVKKEEASLTSRREGPRSVALLRIEQHAGHGGADLVKQLVEAKADQAAFLFHSLGVTPSGQGAGR